MRIQFFIIYPLMCMCLSSYAQPFLGIHSSPYGGVSNVDFNPAMIVNSPYKVDINLIGGHATIANNYISVNMRRLLNSLKPHVIPFSISNKQDVSFQKRVHAAKGYASASIHWLSAMVDMKKKGAFSFGFSSHLVANIHFSSTAFLNASESVLRGQNSSLPIFVKGNGFLVNRFAIQSMAWSNLAMTYGREIIDRNQHHLKMAATLKVIFPMQSLSIYARQASLFIDFSNQNIINLSGDLNLTSSSIDQFFTPNSTLSSKDIFKGTPTLAGDIGLEYVYKTRHTAFRKSISCHSSKNENASAYFIKFGFAISNLGRIRFNNQRVHRYDLSQIQTDIRKANFKVSADAPFNSLIHFSDTFFKPLAKQDLFTMWLPVEIKLYTDIHIIKSFYVHIMTNFAPRFIYTEGKTHHLTLLSITPRYDGRWAGIYLPFSISSYGQPKMGLGLRLGPLLLGVDDMFVLAREKARSFHFYTALKIPILHRVKTNKKRKKSPLPCWN